MSVPPDLLAALARLDPPPGLAGAAERLSAGYRADGGLGGGILRGDAERLAYVLMRMPATAAAVSAALAWAPPRPWRSLLDLGAGSGAGAWAARWRLPDLAAITAVERDAGMIGLGRQLEDGLPDPAAWISADLPALPAIARHDLVLMSYSLGELPEDRRGACLDAAWALAGDALLIVEPGTPRGAAAVLAARTRLIGAGAALAGPCPHRATCPLATGGVDGWGWCHAGVRLPRSRLHRQLKAAALGWEEERFSWLLAVRGAAAAPDRVLAPPRRAGGGIALLLCAADGAARQVVVRRGDPRWPAARRARWGDGVAAPLAPPAGASTLPP